LIFNIGGEENYRIQMAAPAPVFKNKGNIAEVINYRGITVYGLNILQNTIYS
jgi:hypothetical protein